MIEQKLPSLGEGVEKGIIVSILVKEGDEVSLDQALMELETDKVTVEIPAEQAGVVGKILVKLGDEIPEGTPLIQIQGSAEPVKVAEEKVQVQVALLHSSKSNRVVSFIRKNGAYIEGITL